MSDLEDTVLQDLYSWVDKIPLSRPKRNIARDFSDGVLMAEVIKHFFPKLVDLHNFPTCHGVDMKKKNWFLLNWKVFKKLNFELSDDVIENLAVAKVGVIEKVLFLLRTKMDRLVYYEKGKTYDQRVEADQLSPKISKCTLKEEKNLMNKNQGLQRQNFTDVKAKKDMISNRVFESKTKGHRGETELVPKITFEEKVQECLVLEETVEILNAKVRRLEHLLSLKDAKIDSLNDYLSRFRK